MTTADISDQSRRSDGETPRLHAAEVLNPQDSDAAHENGMEGNGSTMHPGQATNPKLPQPEAQRSRPPIFCLGMARTGTASLAAALSILGVERIHHGLETYKDDWQWDILDRAADATFPVLPTYTGKPFTRAEWDELWSQYDVGTDIASFYAMSLIAAYPDAKVILVERDIDRWHESIRVVFEPWSRWTTRRGVSIIGKLARSKAGHVSLKFSKGWTESTDPRDLWKNARPAYVKHYAKIRASVPPEQLLDYKLSDGWEPLAAFLGKPAPGPEVKFPHVNDAAAYGRHRKTAQKYILKKAAKNIFFTSLLENSMSQ
ncbi:hypothetical protein NLG97_g1965 [Lecanicillium saksenae]|uniref:Uncharacterized protein n=1 Tax=Lecanicillium saksenae TaxID=468837 RepID=A0ACC1R3N1_9HYPO|nr:hypothetical protein NLG97_g1965 [Lecanicillium saksenae]